MEQCFARKRRRKSGGALRDILSNLMSNRNGTGSRNWIRRNCGCSGFSTKFRSPDVTEGTDSTAEFPLPTPLVTQLLRRMLFPDDKRCPILRQFPIGQNIERDIARNIG